MLIVLFVGKGVSNDGAVKLAKQLKISYDYIDVDEDINKDYSVIIKGPGISYDSPIIKKYLLLNKLIITDIEFTYWFLNRYYIGITGSNGKTTTTLLINNILSKKYKSVACGNIGYSMGDAAVNNKDCTHFVCELSSFELKGVNYFTPNIAIITNVSCCHLDYHKTFEDYFESKKKMINNQSNKDYLIYNLDCENTKLMIKDSKAILYNFSLNNENATCYIKKNYIYFNKEKYLSIKKIKEKNKSILGNYLASIITGEILGVSKKEIINSLINYKTVEYRCEYIKKNIINDAKSTNVYSTINAIKSINKPIILLCGGYYRNYELNQLDNYLNKILIVVCYGQSKDLLIEYFTNKNIKCYKYDSFELAIKQSIYFLNKKNILLYSPMYASYDMFKSYKERGEQFNKVIKELDI